MAKKTRLNTTVSPDAKKRITRLSEEWGVSVPSILECLIMGLPEDNPFKVKVTATAPDWLSVKVQAR